MYIIDMIENTGKYTQAEIACIRYSYLSIRNDLGKILIIIGVCTLMGTGKESILILMSMIPVRMLMGGIHAKSFLRCLLISFGWVTIGIGLARVMEAWSEWLTCITLASSLVLIHADPIESANKRCLINQERKRRKRLSILIALIGLLIMVIINNPIYKNCICMGLLIDNIQLFILDKRRKKE